MATLKFVRSSFRANSGLEPRLLDNLTVTAARPGHVTFELLISKQHTNRLGIIHGGTIASMVDLGGSLAVASKGLFSTGVSTDLSVTYLATGGKVGDLLTADARCDKFGKNLAYTSVVFTNSKGDMAARGSHTKYVAVAFGDERNKVGELEREEGDVVGEGTGRAADNGKRDDFGGDYMQLKKDLS